MIITSGLPTSGFKSSFVILGTSCWAHTTPPTKTVLTTARDRKAIQSTTLFIVIPPQTIETCTLLLNFNYNAEYFTSKLLNSGPGLPLPSSGRTAGYRFSARDTADYVRRLDFTVFFAIIIGLWR
jgi:hypothetical protein